jgi:hypothetical protein
MIMLQRTCVLTLASLLAASAAHAQYTLPEFNGPFAQDGFPVALTVGAFEFTPQQGLTLASAIVSGTFGNSVVSTSAAARVFLDGILIAACADLGDCSLHTVDWSYTFTPSDFSLFDNGPAVLSVIQDGGAVVRLGETRLALDFVDPAMVAPEPASLVLVGTGLLPITGLARSRRRPTA